MYPVYTFIACPLSALDSVVHLLAFDVPGFPIGKARKQGQKMQRSIAAFFGQRAGRLGVSGLAFTKRLDDIFDEPPRLKRMITKDGIQHSNKHYLKLLT
jgi:hypothetical protein